MRLFNIFITLSVRLFNFLLINGILKVIPSNLSIGRKIHIFLTMFAFLTVFRIKRQDICPIFCGFECSLGMFESGKSNNSKIQFLQAKRQKSLQKIGSGQS